MVFKRHEKVERIGVAGLISGGVGGGRKGRDAFFTTQHPWSSQDPLAGLQGGAIAVTVVDTSKWINAGTILDQYVGHYSHAKNAPP